jgi:hypothetical protein
MSKKAGAKLLIATLLVTLTYGFSQAQADYRSSQQITTQLQSLSRQYSSLAKLQSIGKSDGGKDIWVLTLGLGDIDNHPAIVVAGGVDGRYIVSTELALKFAEQLLGSSQTDSVKNLLSTTTFYVLPNVNPEATDQFFASLKYARTGNGRATDDDRDGQNGEDGYEDLNGDGLVTMIRVEDATGEWKKHEADDRIMVKAKDGEAGGYLYLTEGTDNDKDGAFNEDGAGGINFNNSLTWDFPYFQPGAGDFPVADKENRAVLDFLFERWNVFALVTFGSSDNLNAPIKYNAGEASKRVLKGMLKADADANALVSKSYADIVGKQDGAQSVIQSGGFMEWGYFHYARYSFGTPAWSWPEFKMPEDSAARAKYKANKDKNKEVDYLRWAEANNHDLFVEWKPVNHPDFPGKKVEVGSWKPFAPYNPPFSLVEDISAKQNKFIAKLATMKPKVKIENLTTEALGKGMTRITADIFNAGTLATMTELAQKTRWIRMTKVEMALTGSQQIISGDKVKLISSIEGGDKVTMSWLVKGSGSVKLSAGSAQTGIDTKTITLK